MAVYDRWHKEPAEGDKPCACSRGRNKLYPSADHLKGKRWQVQWEDPDSPARKRLKRNFDLRDAGPGELPDRNKHASAFDKEVQGSIVRQDYTSPNAGSETLKEYAETWRTTRGHSEEAAASLSARLRNHVYEDPAQPGSGRAPRGALAIGQHPMRLLAQRPTMVAAWVTSLKEPLPAERSRAQVVDDLTAMCDAAVEDSVIPRNPMRAKVVDRPGRSGPKAQPYTAAEIAGIRAGLPPRFQVLADMGAGIGSREMELAALGTGDFQFLGKRPRVRVERQIKRVGGKLVFAPLKNRKSHDVPLAPLLAARIARHLELYPAPAVTLPWHEPGSKQLHGQPVTVRLVLAREDGTALARSSVQGYWRTAVGRYLATQAPGRKRRTPHTGWNLHRLRHTYASALLRKGVDVARVAAWMGDTIEMVTKTYLHLMRDDEHGEAEGRAAVDDLFSDDAGARGVPSGEEQRTSGQASGG